MQDVEKWELQCIATENINSYNHFEKIKEGLSKQAEDVQSLSDPPISLLGINLRNVLANVHQKTHAKIPYSSLKIGSNPNVRFPEEMGCL